MAKAVLTLIEINLLLNSEEPQNTKLYGNLFFCLTNLETETKKLKAVSLDQLPLVDNKAIAALTYNKRNLISLTTKEWIAENTYNERPKRDMVCELCNTKIKNLFYIFNRKNSNELRVGSECIKNFPDMEGYKEQKKQFRDIQKGQQVISRRNKFYDMYPDAEKFISDADNYFSTLPVLLPFEIYSKLKDTIIRMRLIYTLYVNEGKKPFRSSLDSFELFKLAIAQYEKLKVLSEKHVSEYSNHKLICKRPEIDWLISEDKTRLLQQISENGGLYTLSTLKNMCSISFVKEYLELILSKNNSDLMRFNRLNKGGLIFSFNKFGYHPAILFDIHLKDFMQYIGAECIINDNFTYGSKEILSISTITNSKNNLYSIIEYIDNIMNLLNCVFLVDDMSNSLYLYRKGDRAVRKFSYYAFIQNYSKYMVLSDEKIKRYLISAVKGNNNIKWITTEMQSKQGIDDKISMLYKAYKESHKYNNHPTGRVIELMTYGVYNNTVSDTPKLDFNSSEYVLLQRNKLKIEDYQLRSVEYGLRINDDSLYPLYHKGDILLVQSTQKFKKNAVIFFATEEKILIQNCHSVSEEPESIFSFSSISKKELVSYGKVIYCFRNKTDIEEQYTIAQNNVEVFVTDNPRFCSNCSSHCTYKHIEYLQDNKKSRHINVAVCSKCNKYYIDRNSYITYMKNKKETNLEFILKN